MTEPDYPPTVPGPHAYDGANERRTMEVVSQAVKDWVHQGRGPLVTANCLDTILAEIVRLMDAVPDHIIVQRAVARLRYTRAFHTTTEAGLDAAIDEAKQHIKWVEKKP